MFSIITLNASSPADKYFVRHLFQTYRKFNSLFQIFDLREYRTSENRAEVTILDRFAMFALLQYENVALDEILERLEGTKNLALLTSDLHHWSIFPNLRDQSLLSLPQLTPEANNNKHLYEMFDRLEIAHLISNYECPELEQIRIERPDLSTYVIELHVDTNVFKDHQMPKEYDLILYGSMSPSTYPFRHRVSKLALQSPDLKVLWITNKESLYDPEICGDGLAKKINKSWLGLSTISNFDYLVGKYFEIPACRTVLLGNMNEQGKAIFGDNYIHIDGEMSDRQILRTIGEAVADRGRLQTIADRMYSVIHQNFKLEDCERKLFSIAKRISETADQRSPIV